MVGPRAAGAEPKQDDGDFSQSDYSLRTRALVSVLTRKNLLIRDHENIPPALYLSLPYYARWLYVQERAAIEAGIVTEDELRDPDGPDGPLETPELPGFVPPSPEALIRLLGQDASARIDADVEPRFEVGDAVIARNEYPAGITRMPGYVRGRRGVIDRDHGVYPFQDTLPPGEPRRSQHVYSVRFSSRELWASRGNPRDYVHADLWGDHLEAAGD